MNEIEVNAQIQTLIAQRNAAMDQVVILSGKTALQIQQMQEANDALKKQIEELEAKLKAPQPAQEP